MAICNRCRKSGPVLSFLTTDLVTGEYYCEACTAIMQRERNDARHKAVQERQLLAGKAAGVVMTTTQHIEGHYVRNYLGIESVEYVIGTGVFSEVSSGVADFFGQRSTQFEGKLQQAKKTAMDALKMLAAEKGANAVIGVDIDYTEFSGNRVALIVNGTLVRVAPLKSREKGTRG